MTQILWPTTGLTPAQAWQRLSRRQQRFVVSYRTEPNAAEAARQAGYSANGAKVQGFRLLARPDVQAVLRCDPLEVTRLYLASIVPGTIELVLRDAMDDNLSALDNLRAGRLLLEVAGMVKSGRRGRG